MQHDANKPEDLATQMEDHAADEWRYFCMSRPLAAVQRKNNVVRLDRWDKAFSKESKYDWATG